MRFKSDRWGHAGAGVGRLALLLCLVAPGAQAQVVKCVNPANKTVTFANNVAQCPAGSTTTEVAGKPAARAEAPPPRADILAPPVLVPPAQPASETVHGNNRVRTKTIPVFTVKPPP